MKMECRNLQGAGSPLMPDWSFYYAQNESVLIYEKNLFVVLIKLLPAAGLLPFYYQKRFT